MPKPYLESAPDEEVKGKDDSDADANRPLVKTINRENFKQILNENKLTVIAVFGRKC